MHTFMVTVHLPRVGSAGEQGLVAVVTPSGIVEYSVLTRSEVDALTDPEEYAVDLVGRMFPGKKNRIHGTVTEYRGPYINSSHVQVVRVDTDEA